MTYHLVSYSARMPITNQWLFWKNCPKSTITFYDVPIRIYNTFNLCSLTAVSCTTRKALATPIDYTAVFDCLLIV